MDVTTVDELAGYLRRSRGFDAAAVLELKVDRIATWFAAEGLDAAVVGVSGGIDSAVVLGLLQRVANRTTSAAGSESGSGSGSEPGTGLRRVIGLVAPIDRPGATGQDTAARRGEAVVRAAGAELWCAPLGAVQDEAVAALEAASGSDIDPWSAGQLLSVVRTPVLYGAAALLQAAGHRSVVAGTTNRDEGAYLGFFGKASDGMVDVQIISDLHKSEVRALAALLAVPDEVLAAAPAGDVWDGRTDREMIGASYDEVEIVLRLRELQRDPTEVEAALVDGARLVAAAAAVDRLHATNAHKYRVGSPAVHLDVLPRGIPGGWSDTVLSGRGERRPPRGQLPGEWEPHDVTLSSPCDLPAWHLVRPRPCGPATEGRDPTRPTAALATVAPGVLGATDCERLIEAMHAQACLEPVDVTGYRTPMTPGARSDPRSAMRRAGGAAADAREQPSSVSTVVDASEPGSERGTAWSPALADALWARVRPIVPGLRLLDPLDATDGFATDARTGHRAWRVVGLSPVLRFMCYRPGGRHLGHYDAGFDYGDGRRTLVSMVLFLTGAGDGVGAGATRFVHDGQEALPVWARDHDDWTRDATSDEILAEVAPCRGSVLLFDHRRCHDVERWAGPGERVVIRGDVVYEAIPDGRSFP